MSRLSLAGLVATFLLVLVLIGSLVMGIARSPAEGGDAERSVAVIPEGRVRVEVLNAAGIPRLAQRGTDQLRDLGFDVVYYGNAHGFHPDTSLVLDRVGDADAAAAVAEALGLRQVREAPDTSLYLEVTVILGSDWALAKEERPPED